MTILGERGFLRWLLMYRDLWSSCRHLGTVCWTTERCPRARMEGVMFNYSMGAKSVMGVWGRKCSSDFTHRIQQMLLSLGREAAVP